MFIKGASMVQRRRRERSLFEVLLPDGHKLWPDWLRKIDTLLEDEAVIEVVAQALEARWPQSRRRGRPGTQTRVAEDVAEGRSFSTRRPRQQERDARRWRARGRDHYSRNDQATVLLSATELPLNTAVRV
jgi:hypothetical protein